MFKILIVDDEKIVLDAVKFILDNNFEDSVVYDTARSGREAIEKADIFNPDIILMDIRMPGINGIEAIKEIKRIKSKIHFIIVSAYEQFDFAKEAVELKVDDYILKPIIKKNLINVLNKTMEKIEVERETKKKELESIEKQESIVPFLENALIYSIILGEHNGSKINEYKDIVELGDDGGYIILLEVNEKHNASDRNLLLGSTEMEMDNEFSYYPLIIEAFKCKCRCFIGPEILNKITIFIPSHMKPGHMQRKEAFELTEFVNKRLYGFKDAFTFNFGIGNYKKLDNISESYDEALMAVKYTGNKNIVCFDEMAKTDNYISEYPKEYENKLLDKLADGDADGVLNSFARIYEWIYGMGSSSFILGKSKLMELMVIIHRTSFANGVKENEFKDFVYDIYNIDDYQKLENWCKDRLTCLIKCINIGRQKKNNKIVLQAKEYIYENYHYDITLEDVAKEVCVSPHYFSRLFKEETGENFIEYLTVFRIKKAKYMMDNTNLNMKEICYKIGYSDPNYFSRLFKKIEKVTPTDYLKTLNKG